MTNLPTFFIFGATKSGTSSLYFYLKQHPDVFMSGVKEPHFFGFEPGSSVREVRNGELRENSYVITDEAEYRRLFRDAGGAHALGEASVMYLYLEGAAERLRAGVPDARLVAVLRNPVERAYSAYLHLIREEDEPCRSFSGALDAEPGRIVAGWAPLYHYQNMGFYARQLQRFYAQFPAEQFKIFLYEDLEREPERVIREIYGFIGVDPSFRPDISVRHNISGVPQNPLAHEAYRFLKRSGPVKNVVKRLLPEPLRSRTKRRLLARIEANNLRKPPLSAEARARLIAAYREDIGELQELLGRDLSGWLQ